MTELLKNHRVLVCVGSGGVGKTTVSASLAVRAAQIGLNVLVMTIDPSRRLKVALGINDDHKRFSEVPGQNYPGKLSAALLNADEIFKEFITQSASHPEMAERLLNNRLYKQLSTTLSGSQEFTSLLQLSKIVSEKKYDLVILDTPPAQHAVDFLEAPDKINALFHDSIVRWFLGDEEQIGLVRKIIARGTRTVLTAFERITGSQFMRELNDFFVSVRAIQAKIGARTQQVQEILRAPTTGFLLITGFDEAKLKEAGVLNDYLVEKGYHQVSVLINRAFPEWSLDQTREEEPRLAEIYLAWSGFHKVREQIFKKFYDLWSKKLPVVRIPDLNSDINGLQGLEVIAHEMDDAFISLRNSRL